MATMLGICTNSVRLVFQELPSMPDMSTDPLAHYVPLEDLHLQRMRELDHAHRVQYTVNLEYIANLSSRLQAATELVAKTIFHVLGNNECAQKAVEGVRGCRTPELADDVARRTVRHPGPIHVCKEDPAVHKGLPTFVWETPGADAAFIRVAAKCGLKTIADFEDRLLWQQINMFRRAIAAQQQVIRFLVNALSEAAAISLLHTILRNHRVPKKTITLICAKVVGWQCHWTTAVPTHWLSEPVKTRSSGKQPSCVIVEEPNCCSSNTNSSKGWRLLSVRVAKAVAAAGVTVASMLANRHGA